MAFFIEGGQGSSGKTPALMIKASFSQVLQAVYGSFHVISFLIVLVGVVFYLRSSDIIEFYLCFLIFLFFYKRFSPEYGQLDKYLNGQRRDHEAG